MRITSSNTTIPWRTLINIHEMIYCPFRDLTSDNSQGYLKSLKNLGVLILNDRLKYSACFNFTFLTKGEIKSNF